MKVVYYFGAHCTDGDRLLKCLLKNADPLSEQGIVVPGPSRYRTAFRDATTRLRGQPAPRPVQDEILDACLDIDRDKVTRLVFANTAFLSAPAMALGDGQLYPAGGDKTGWLVNMFPEHETELFFAIRDPATWVPALFAKAGGDNFRDFLDAQDPRQLRWSDLIARIREITPDCPLTVWCNEDNPLLWPELLRALSGHAPGLDLDGRFDFLSGLMRPKGFQRFVNYLDDHPPRSDAQMRKVIAAFLEKYPRPEQFDMLVDLPGWSQELMDELSALYDDDLARIAAMPGVTVIAP